RLEAHRLAGRARGLLALAHEPTEDTADRHQPRAADLRAQRAGDAVDVRHIVAQRPGPRSEPGLQLGDVGGDLRHCSREDPGVVVTVELELGEHFRDRPRGALSSAARGDGMFAMGSVRAVSAAASRAGVAETGDSPVSSASSRARTRVAMSVTFARGSGARPSISRSTPSAANSVSIAAAV